MKKLVILPGNSPKNKTWGEEVAATYGAQFDAVYQQDYDHWESGEETIDFEREAEKLRDAVASDGGADVEHYVFAKSFGSILTLLSVHKGYVVPAKCVFFGMPLNLVEEQNIFGGNWAPLRDFSVPAIAFHNEDDPVADHTFTSNTLAELGVSSITFMSCNGDTHGYTEHGDYTAAINAFLGI